MPDVTDDRTVGLVQAVRERRISLRTLDRAPRAAVIVTIAGIGFAALLTVARELTLGSVRIGALQDEQVTLSWPLFGGSLLLLSVGYGFLMAGALFASRVVAGVGVGVLTLLVAWQTGVLGLGGLSVILPDWALWTTRALLLANLAIAVTTLAIRRGRSGDDPRDRLLRAVVLVLVPAIFLSYFLVVGVASPVLNGLTLFPLSVALLMQAVSLLATPMLMIAAVDFGEWGELAGERLGAIRQLRDARREALRDAQRPRMLVSALLCGLAVVVGVLLGTGTLLNRAGFILQSVAVLAIVVTVLVGAGLLLRLPGSSRTRPGFAALVVVCAILSWVGPATIGAVSGGFLTPTLAAVDGNGNYTSTANVRSIRGVTGYSALVPVGWDVSAGSGGTIDVVRSTFSDGSTGTLLGTSVTADTTMTTMLHATQATAVGSPSGDGSWQKLAVTSSSGARGVIWLGDAAHPESVGLAFYGTASGADPSQAFRSFEAVVRTVRPAGAAPVTLPEVLASNGNAPHSRSTDSSHPDRDPDLYPALGAAFAGLLGLLAFVVLLAGVRRRASTWRTTMLFVGVVAAVAVAAASDSVGRELFGADAAWPILTIGGVVAGTGILGALALLVGSRTRADWGARLPGALPGLLGAVIVLGVLNRLYTVALTAAEAPVWAAVLILVAVGWDLAMSGESLTNRATRRFPRSARVVAFAGYLLVLASTIVFFTGQLSAATGAPVSDPYFEPESITQAALFRIGLPVFLLIFLMRVARPAADGAETPAQLKSASGAEP